MSRTLYSAENERLAAWLKEQREAKQLTMRTLADRLGVPHTVITKVENQDRRLDVVEYVAYCKALEVSPVEGLMAIDPNLRAKARRNR